MDKRYTLLRTNVINDENLNVKSQTVSSYPLSTFNSNWGWPLVLPNNFFNNTGYESHDPYSQGLDDGYDNMWYNPSFLLGNFWNDLGFNSTYEIAGSAGSIDFYSLSSPV